MRVSAWAWRENTGAIDLDSISPDVEGVRWKQLQYSMGWRFKYPDRYSHDDAWAALQAFGSIVPVDVTIVEVI
jgi:hypothetical protein